MDDLRASLQAVLDAHGLARDVEDATDFGDEVLGDAPMDASEMQWFLLGEALSTLDVHDEIFTPMELILLLRYLAHATEQVEDQEMLIDFPFDEFPDGTAECCEAGLVVAVDGYLPDDIEALLVRAGDHRPGESGTVRYHIAQRGQLLRFDDPLPFLQALIAGA